MSKLLGFTTFVIALTVIHTTSCAREVRNSNFTPRIFGGHTTTISSVKYLVQLLFNDVFSCGGTLVSRSHVVTAAHCVRGVQSQNLTVKAGASTHNEAGHQRNVKAIYIPKKYRESTLYMDVAVLKLEKPMTGLNTKPIGLCNSNLSAGDMVQVSGWGMTGGRIYPNQVHTMMIPLISMSNCKKMYKNRNWIKKTMICAALPGKKDFCLGDSGGPLIYNKRLCGVVSWGMMGNGCQRTSFPGVYTNVKVVETFIRRCMKK